MADKRYKDSRVYFYQLALGKRTDRDAFRRNVIKLWDIFDKRQYSQAPEMLIDEQKVYVSAMEKVPLGIEVLPDGKALNTFALMMNIQRINPHEQVKFGDLTMSPDVRLKTLSNELAGMQDESKHAKKLIQQINDGQIGPLVNSPILYDPFRRILLRVRQNGDLSNQQLVRFIKQSFRCPGVYMQMILDGQSTADMDAFDALVELRYAVASPNNFVDLADNDRSEFQDLAVASDMHSQDIQVVMTGSNLTKRAAKKKVTDLLTDHDGFETKKAIVKGIADGSDKEIDFFKNRLRYDGKIDYDSTTGITIKDCFNLLAWAYKNKLEFLKNRYNLEWD